MQRPPLARPLGLVLLAVLLAAATACGPQPSVEAPVGWARLDLTEAEPAVEQDAHAAGDLYDRRIGYLGREEVRDMSRVPESQLAAFPFRRAPQIRVLEEAAGVRLAWRVELGADPYASFIPLGWSGEPCRCLYRFGLRDARGELHELHREEAEEVSPRAPGTVEVDLSGFAHSTVDLLLQVDTMLGAPPPAAGAVPSLLWGSPAVYHRRPVEGWRPPGPDGRPPNVILIGADTLRADHVGPWRNTSYAPTLTPAIDRLAAESDVWLRAYSTFNITNPSFASIFTGLYGKNHGVYDFQTALAADHETLAERFADAGYETLAVIAASHLGDHNSGLGQGFDRTVLSQHTFAGELPVDVAMEWIAERHERSEDGAKPFFAWLHLFDPHTPHTPPGPFGVGLRPAGPTGLGPIGSWVPFRRVGDREFEQPVLGGERDLYAGEVAYLDRQVDRLLGFLESRDLLEETIVVFVSDHGENLGEHGIDFRHAGLFETTTHVPLMIRWPGRAGPGAAERPAEPSERGRRFEGLVQTLDLYPTLLAGAGLEAPPSDGTDLRQLTYDGRPGRRAVFAEHASSSGVMVRTPTHRYARIVGVFEVPEGPHLYDLAADQDETRNLAGRGLPVEAELSALLDRWLRDRRETPEAESRELTEEDRRKLRSLGYLD